VTRISGRSMTGKIGLDAVARDGLRSSTSHRRP
jgi:hypothetical protein